MRQVSVAPTSPSHLADVLVAERAEAFLSLVDVARMALEGRVIWNVSSTAGGGGVAEMLQGFLRYVRGAGVDCRWVVLEGTPDFFAVTKRLHNRLHGDRGDGGPLGDSERDAYLAVTNANAVELAGLVGARDIVILHDPQAVGLAPRLRDVGVPVLWRSHIGTDSSTTETDEGWAFIRPWVEAADAAIFSRRSYAPAWIDPAKVTVIAPAIDPLSPKNRELRHRDVLATLGQAGIIAADAKGSGSVHADVLREGDPVQPDVPVVLQISRWDRLKDMAGVFRGFIDARVAEDTGAHLFLVGPDVRGVTDDPEGQEIFDACAAEWRALPSAARQHASLITLPMDDLEQNAVVVNALQRHATVVVQKSLMEGFGLTVAEAMWKSRPVVASAVGGIQDQVRDGKDGVLLPDPHDLDAFAAAVRRLLTDQAEAAQLGTSAHERVRDNFLADRDLSQWMALIEQLQSS